MRNFILFIFCLLNIHSLTAQRVHLELLGGPGFTSLSNSNPNASSISVNSFSTMGELVGFGVLVSDSATEMYGFNAQLNYAFHNQKYEAGSGITSFYSKIKLNYLDIPLLFHYGSTLGPFFEIGPQFSFLMSAKEDATFNNQQIEFSKDYSGDFNSLLIMGDVGLGVNVYIAKHVTFNWDFRFSYGFLDAVDQNSDLGDHSVPYYIATSSGQYSRGKYYSTTRMSLSILGNLLFEIP